MAIVTERLVTSNVSGVMISMLQSRLIGVLDGVILFLGKTISYKLLISTMLNAHSLMLAVENNNYNNNNNK